VWVWCVVWVCVCVCGVWYVCGCACACGVCGCGVCVWCVYVCVWIHLALYWIQWQANVNVVRKKKAGKFLSNSTAVMFCKVTLFISLSSESQAWYCRKLFNNYYLLQECPTGLVDEESFKNIFSQFFPQGGKYLLLQCPVTCRNNICHAECIKERHVAMQMILVLLSVRPLHCHGKKSHWCPFAACSL